MNDSSYETLLKHLAKTDQPNQIKALFTALLTDKEQQDIANRIRIFDLLDQGVTQREISQRLGVGIATVSRGAKTIQHNDVSELLNTLRETGNGLQ